MANNWWAIIISLLNFSFAISQQDTNYYRIQFSDKLNSTFDISQPNAFLSEKAILRRENQNISISVEDLPINQNYIDQVLSFDSVEYVTHSKWFNQLVILCYDTNSFNNIQNLPFVSGTEIFSNKMKVHTINDKLKVEELPLKHNIDVNSHYPYGSSYAQNHLHQIDLMHELSFNGQGMDIAVIDAGFYHAQSLDGLKHLFSEGQILSTYDFVDLEKSVNEDHYHGSAVLSVMAGYIEGEFYGTAIKANYHLLRSEDANAEYIIEEDFWVRAAEYADSAGCDIINTSLGYTTFDDSTQNHTYNDLDGNTTLIARASDIASSKGILCVTSAGNLGESSWGYIGTPADADSTLTVGAIDQYNQLAPFSSFGPSSDGDIKPNVTSVGWLTYLIAPWDNAIIMGNGTSFSSPMVSGMAACLWQALPHLSNIELKNLIESTANQNQSPDTLRGHGYPLIFNAYNEKTGISYQEIGEITIEKVYPNPSNYANQIQIIVTLPQNENLDLIFIDPLGKIIERNSLHLTAGRNLLTLSPNHIIKAGVYQLILQSTDKMVIKKIVLN